MTYPEIEWCHERGSYIIKETPTHLVEVLPMLFNDRIVLTPKNCPYIYDAGWCYDKGGAAFVFALAWDPDAEHEPVGYKKVALPRERTTR